MLGDPALSKQQVTLVLQHVCAEGHPALAWLRDRLARDDAAAWLDRVSDEEPVADVDCGASERAVRVAVRSALAIAAGDSATPIGANLDLLDRIWDAIAEAASHPVADACRTACIALERAGVTGGMRGGSAEIGRFELGKVIGRGAAGTVFRARHVDNGLLAAVKLLHPGVVDTESTVRFRNEARLVGKLCHPAIVRLLDSGVQERDGALVAYVAYALIDGRPFDVALAGRPQRTILQTFAQLCDGVEHAHAAHVLHRDLKPANVHVDAAGNPHVLDFGIARSMVPQGEHGFHTVSGQVLGTPGFMSPEQAAGRDVDVRSDVWSLGALLFVTLAGETPHPLAGLGVLDALARVAGSEPRRIRTLRPLLDRDLAAVVDKALAGDPAHRYATVADLVRDVRRLLAGDPVDARPPTALQSLCRIARRHRRTTAAALAMISLVMVGCAVVAVLWRRAVSAEERAVNLSAEALVAAGNGVRIAARLAETTMAAEEQLRLLGPVLSAVAALQEMASDRHEEWLTLESGLHEVGGDLALRVGDRASARRHRERVLALEDELVTYGLGVVSDRARALVKLGDLDQTKAPANARHYFEEAHAIFAAVAAGPDADLHALDDLSWSFYRLAGIALIQGRLQDSAAHARAHLALAERMIAASPDALRQYNLATALLHLRKCERRDQGIGDEDLAELTRARVAAEAAVVADDQRRAYLMAALQCNDLEARCLLHRGSPVLAVERVSQAIRFAARMVPIPGGDAEARVLLVGLTSSCALLARGLWEAPAGQRDPEQASRFARQAAALLAQTPDGRSGALVVQVLNQVGMTAEAAAAAASFGHSTEPR
jgi:hypothetical protein